MATYPAHFAVHTQRQSEKAWGEPSKSPSNPIFGQFESGHSIAVNGNQAFSAFNRAENHAGRMNPSGAI